MSVRKRVWVNTKGVEQSGWVADYVDSAGKRRRKMFDKKKEADAFLVTARHEVKEGSHVADADSATVAVAGRLWIAAKERVGRERSTIDQYTQHLNIHIVHYLGDVRLNALTMPLLRKFEDDLLDAGRSPAMVRKVLVSLGSLIADAQERGLVARNIVRDMRSRRSSTDRRADKRAKGKLQVGVDIPSPEEIRAIIGGLEGRWRPLILTAIFCGLRASELRGLTWSNVDLTKKVIHVRQRADRFKGIGKPKSGAGERAVPMPPMIVNTLKEWKLAGTKSEKDLVFPAVSGEVVSIQQIVRDGFMPAQIRAGVVDDSFAPDPEGGRYDYLKAAKYSGLHSLRHFHASWLINRLEDGGLGLPPKVVQARLGHSSISMTLDVYGHLFPTGDEGEAMAAAEAILLGR